MRLWGTDWAGGNLGYSDASASKRETIPIDSTTQQQFKANQINKTTKSIIYLFFVEKGFL